MPMNPFVPRDRGKGFDPKSLDCTKSAPGLGLVSLRERVSYLGGVYTIESAPGQGSRFSLTLPFSTIAVGSPHADQAAVLSIGINKNHHDDRDKVRVMVVDDHSVMRQGLVRPIPRQPESTLSPTEEAWKCLKK